ncbi:FkbM family methyltransferase [Lamprobacter modestohalophilus]|uniref:FkbM family methyltransferase n=1 Tax=Lamprobacter modestohalophilus TaxID=1064514 RepID=UPI002ADEC665|nr:FkbM family methyltransferase [Lamprobacter modestohalophilus]MEA1053147.1 FkbM family methyltransferase [Lamprobacter modestohalophilus]
MNLKLDGKKSQQVSAADIAFCEKFMSASGGRYVLGRNDFSAELGSCLTVDAFIDDFADVKEFSGKPVIATEQVPEGSLVISTSISRLPKSAIAKLRHHKLNVMDYFSFKKASDLPLLDSPLLSEFTVEFDRHQDYYQKLYDRFADQVSKNIFESIISFRLMRDLSYLDGFEYIPERQYFEPFLLIRNEGEIFLDVGAYDGDTTEAFISQYPKYEKVHLFEPDSQNLERLSERLLGYDNIHAHPYGAWNENRKLNFRSAGSASGIENGGEEEVDVRRIEDVIQGPVTYIKMDIEGSEAPAIEGAQSLIKKYRPRLAICVYHKSEDLRVIPQIILSMNNDYKVFLRHYTEGLDETVMYFV